MFLTDKQQKTAGGHAGLETALVAMGIEAAGSAPDARKFLYVIISQPGTVVSKLLKAITGASYNHVSVSLDRSLRKMYSFGRVHPYNPVWGGFVMESPNKGTFRRFADTEAVVLCVPIDDGQYRRISGCLASMYRQRKMYHYNYLGLVLAGFHISYHSRNRYYCSEFVKELLVKFGVIEDGQFGGIVKPIEFLHLKNADIVYRGKLNRYAGPVLANEGL